MNNNLVRFLIHNKNQILETWLAEIELPACILGLTHRDVSYDFLEFLYNELLDILINEDEPIQDHPPFYNFRDCTFNCQPGKPTCSEFYRSWKRASSEVIDASCNDSFNLSQSERAEFKKHLNKCVVILIYKEVIACCQDCAKPYCPFLKETQNEPFLDQENEG